MTQEVWLLDRAMAMLARLVDERDRRARCLVSLPPEGASLLEIERAALVAALDRVGWSQKDAAKLLGTTARVVNSKMQKYDIYRDNPNPSWRQKRGTASGPRGHGTRA